MGIGTRLKEYRRIKGISTITDFSEIIGISQGSLSDIENEKSFPSADTLQKMVHHTDINVHWLLTGEGAIIRDKIEDEEKSVQTLFSIIKNYPDFRDLSAQFINILLYLRDKHWEGKTFSALIDGFHDRIMNKETRVGYAGDKHHPPGRGKASPGKSNKRD